MRYAVSKLDPGSLSNTYSITPADLYSLEQCAAPAWLASLANGASAITFGNFAGRFGFLSSFGFFSFVAFGRCLSAQRDAVGSPVRSSLQLVEEFCHKAGLLRVNTALTASAFTAWLESTKLPSHLSLLEERGLSVDRRDLCLRSRHHLLFGTSDQKLTILSSILQKEPLKSSTPSIQLVIGDSSLSDVRSALTRLVRGVTNSPSAVVSDLAAVQSLEASLGRFVSCLTALGMVGAFVSARIDEILHTRSSLPSSDGHKSAGASSNEGSFSLSQASASIYADQLTEKLGSPEWRRVEATLSAE